MNIVVGLVRWLNRLLRNKAFFFSRDRYFVLPVTTDSQLMLIKSGRELHHPKGTLACQINLFCWTVLMSQLLRNVGEVLGHQRLRMGSVSDPFFGIVSCFTYVPVLRVISQVANFFAKTVKWLRTCQDKKVKTANTPSEHYCSEIGDN